MIPDEAYNMVWRSFDEYKHASEHADKLKTNELIELISDEEAKMNRVHKFLIDKRIIDPPIKISAYKDNLKKRPNIENKRENLDKYKNLITATSKRI